MPKRRFAALAAAVGSCLCLCQCAGSSPSSPTPGPGSESGGPTGSTAVVPPAIVVAAGDIGECGFGALDTGRLLDTLPGTILALGDIAYMEGSAANFRDCYDPAWGRHRDRTHPAPGC